MALKFNQLGYHWDVREGFPPMFSTEVAEPVFVDALRAACPEISESKDRELASWIVARLNYLTAGALVGDGDEFTHDMDEFGYKIKLTDPARKTLAHGAVVIRKDRTYFAAVQTGIDDFQSLFVQLLADDPQGLVKCLVRVQYPESNRLRLYGWDGHSLITHDA